MGPGFHQGDRVDGACSKRYSTRRVILPSAPEADARLASATRFPYIRAAPETIRA